jgi:hypothetical protein
VPEAAVNEYRHFRRHEDKICAAPGSMQSAIDAESEAHLVNFRTNREFTGGVSAA